MYPLRHMSVFASLALVSLSLCVASALAGPREVGRTPDGRAYRTDAEGNQIIDYIAELELNREAQKQQVIGLETELEEKRKLIERLRGQLKSSGTTPVSSKGGVVERDLLANTDDRRSGQTESVLPQAKFSEADMVPTHDQPAIIRPSKQLRVNEVQVTEAKEPCPEPGDSEEVRHLQSLLEGAREELVLERDKSRKTQQQFVAEKAELEGTIVTLRQALAESQEQGRAVEAKFRQAAVAAQASAEVSAEKAPSSMAPKISAVRTMSDEEPKVVAETGAQQDIPPTRAQLAIDPDRRTVSLSAKASARDDEGSSISDERASLKREAPERAASAGKLDLARIRAVDSLRGNMKTELNKLKGMIATRNKLYSSYTRGNRKVNFKTTPAVSSRKVSVKQIERELKGAQSVHELARWRGDIREIRSKVSEDIALIKRMKKIG